MEITKLDVSNYETLKNKYYLSNLAAKVLASKNITNQQLQEVLKEPSLANPMTAHGMKEVVERISLAKKRQEKVLVCGDYDADGICATSILFESLGRFGIQAGFYIPNRFKEGYGLHPNTVQMAKDKGYTLLITVDNGVKAMDALRLAKDLKLDVIVSDHHTMDDEEIPCYCLLHPEHMGEDFKYLSGAGVALEISRALLGDHKEYVILACVASIADVMPLWKETRSIVRLGIQYLKQGLCKPIQLLSNDAQPIWEESLIAFQVVPKLNATGRLADMANANNTVRFLMSKNFDQMKSVAKQINDLNDTRKTMSDAMSLEATQLVNKDAAFPIVYKDTFHEGMVGLVAGKLSNSLHKPIMVLTKHDQQMRGSIRSYGNLDLTTFFDECKDLFSAYGGHKAAAGIGFEESHLKTIEAYIELQMKNQRIEEHSLEVIEIDGSELSLKEVNSLQSLAPFGQGFEEPRFLIKGLTLTRLKTLSKGKHIKWESVQEIDCMFFNCGDVVKKFEGIRDLDFIGHLKLNQFMGKRKVNIFIEEVIIR